MMTVSVSQLKTNPGKAILEAVDYPVVIEKRSKVEAYLLGRELYEKIIASLEDLIDRRAVESADFTRGKDFEKIAEKLGL